MRLIPQLRRFVRALRNPGPNLGTPEPTTKQKAEITEAIRKQRFYGDLPGRRQYKSGE